VSLVCVAGDGFRRRRDAWNSLDLLTLFALFIGLALPCTVTLDGAQPTCRDMMSPRPRPNLARFLTLSAAIGLLASCRGGAELTGTFAGTWTLGGVVMVTSADGGTVDHGTADTPAGIASNGEIVVSKKDDQRYELTLAAPFMACTLTARINDANELVLDGPSPSDLPAGPATLGPWQHCPFTLKGFRGEAHVRGTVRAKAGGVSVVMQILPVGASPDTRVAAGSAAMANFDGQRRASQR
jgi:hypothetical protein